jgi:hypothetical protein
VINCTDTECEKCFKCKVNLTSVMKKRHNVHEISINLHDLDCIMRYVNILMKKCSIDMFFNYLYNLSV